MSAAGRGRARLAGDRYFSPPFVLPRLIERLPLPGGVWLDPFCGDGRLIASVSGVDLQWRGYDLGASMAAPVREVGAEFRLGCSFERIGAERLRGVSVVATNPPYGGDAPERAMRSWFGLGAWLCFLLRLNWLASRRRRDLLALLRPDVFVLPDRPSFAFGGSDACEYCWCVLPPTGAGGGRLEWLDKNPPRAPRRRRV